MPVPTPPVLLNIRKLSFGPRWSSTPHAHSGFRETLVILDGRISVQTPAGLVEAGSGCVVTYPANMAHAEAALDNKSVSLGCIAWKDGPDAELPLVGPDMSGRIRLLAGWLQELDDDPATRHDHALLNGLLRALIHQLLHDTKLVPEDRIHEARRALEAAIAEDVDLTGLARKSGMSRSTFQRRFRALTGLAPMEFLRRCRLDHAKRHIEFTELKAAEIASMVGFKDEFQFSRAFKKHFGMPPTSFRRTQFQTAASPGETGDLRPFVE